MTKQKINRKAKKGSNKYKLVLLYIIIPLSIIFFYRVFVDDNGFGSKHKHETEPQKTELNLKLPVQNK